MKIKSSPYSNLVAVLANLLLAYVVYMLTRVAFVLENWNLFAADWGSLSLWEVFSGSLRFDSSAILYTNSLWIVLMLLPLHLKERPWWQTMCKWIFVVINSLCLVINLVDSVYSLGLLPALFPVFSHQTVRIDPVHDSLYLWEML